MKRPTQEAETPVGMEQSVAVFDRATRLVEQLLSMARHEGAAEQAPAEAVDLADVLRQALSETLPLANAKSIDVELDGAPQLWVQGHRDALALLARNLLDNAVKYTPAGKRVRLRLEQAPGQAILLIDDEGPGIAPAERERVFDRFYRVLGTSSDGSGLGLAIVREITQKHQASVVISDHPTEHSDLPGTRIRVAFPLYTPPPEPAAAGGRCCGAPPRSRPDWARASPRSRRPRHPIPRRRTR